MGQTVRGRIPSRVLTLPRLYPIVDAEVLRAHGIDLSQFAVQLRDAGVMLLQYRDKRGTQEEILRSAKIIQDVFRGVECMMIMNDDPVLAMLSDWNAVHVGQSDAAVKAARSVLSPGGIVGCSTHTEEQVRAADAAGADYIAIGPVFATATKADAESVVGIEGVQRARALTKRPLVAIGGITTDNAAQVIAVGANSVAVIGALFKPDVAAGEIVKIFQERMPTL